MLTNEDLLWNLRSKAEASLGDERAFRIVHARIRRYVLQNSESFFSVNNGSANQEPIKELVDASVKFLNSEKQQNKMRVALPQKPIDLRMVCAASIQLFLHEKKYMESKKKKLQP